MRYFRIFSLYLLAISLVSTIFLVSTPSLSFADEKQYDWGTASCANDGQISKNADGSIYCAHSVNGAYSSSSEAVVTCGSGYKKVETMGTVNDPKVKSYRCELSGNATAGEELLKKVPDLSKTGADAKQIEECINEAREMSSRPNVGNASDSRENQNYFATCLSGKTGKSVEEIKGYLGDIDPVTGGNVTETGSSCVIDGIGWLVCPTITFVGSLNDAMFTLVKTFLSVNSDNVSTNSGTYTAWSIFRNLANAVFVIVFLIIVISQISNIGISNYGIKKILPRLILGAVLINTSFVICQLAVDISEITGHSLKGMLEGISGQALDEVSKDPQWYASLGAVLNGTATVVTSVAVGAIAVYALVAIGVSGALAFLLSMLVTLLILIGRQAGIILLVALSPLAFAAWILPNTENLFKKWSKMLTGLLLVFPIVSLLFGAGTLASGILQSNTNDSLMQIAALLVSGLPLIMTPSLLKNSMNSIDGIGGKLSGLGSRVNNMSGNIATKKLKSSGMGQRLGDFTRERERQRQQRIAHRRATGTGKRFDNSFIGRWAGLDRGSRVAQAAIEKAELEAGENNLRYQYNGDAEKALKEGDRATRTAAMKELANTSWGVEQMRNYFSKGNAVEDIHQAEILRSVKPRDVGLARLGVEAANSFYENPNKPFTTTANELNEFTRSESLNASKETLASQTTPALKQSEISPERAREILNSDSLSKSLSGGNEAHLRSIVEQGGGSSQPSPQGQGRHDNTP